ncbi:hypothetical protein KY336_03630, partial [Candidatus Woesearchaeota archaeon]|nr:hypothetical protein [Candidatus Woesearchaeota archaeon]
MSLTKLAFPVAMAGGIAFGAGDALAQDLPSPPRVEGRELAAKNAETLEELSSHMEKLSSNMEKLVAGDELPEYTGNTEVVKRFYDILRDMKKSIVRARKAGAYYARIQQERFEAYLQEQMADVREELESSKRTLRGLEAENKKLREFNQAYRGANMVILPPVIGHVITPEADKKYFNGILEQWYGKFEGIRVFYSDKRGLSPHRFLEIRRNVNGEMHVYYEEMIQFEFEKVLEGVGKAYAAQEEVYRKQVRNAYQLFMYHHFIRDGHDRFEGTFGDILEHLRETIG